MSSRPYRPLAIANEFILQADPNGVKHMKLQKLIYFAYGWWLTRHTHPILTEAPQIWRHGPVFKGLYLALRHFGCAPIRQIQSDSPFFAAPMVDDADREVKTLVEWIWRRYGGYSSFTLSGMAHAAGTAWHRMAEESNWSVPRDSIIPDEYIRAEFHRETEILGIAHL